MTYLERYNLVLLISFFSKSKSQAPENEILQHKMIEMSCFDLV